MKFSHHLKFILFSSSTLLLLLSCNNLHTEKQSVNNPENKELNINEVKEKQKVKDDIAKYVKLVIDVSIYNMGADGRIYIKNNTDYTIEAVNVALSWIERSSQKQGTQEQSFTYIPAHSESNVIPYSGKVEVKGQITYIKCRALGLE